MNRAAHPVQAPAQPPELRITGVLLTAAEVRHTAGQHSHALLVAEIGGGRGLPYLVQQDLGEGPGSHLAAESKARLLRRGCRVTAIARGLQPRADHDRAVLRLIDCTDLIPHLATEEEA